MASAWALHAVVLLVAVVLLIAGSVELSQGCLGCETPSSAVRAVPAQVLAIEMINRTCSRCKSDRTACTTACAWNWRDGKYRCYPSCSTYCQMQELSPCYGATVRVGFSVDLKGDNTTVPQLRTCTLSDVVSDAPSVMTMHQTLDEALAAPDADVGSATTVYVDTRRPDACQLRAFGKSARRAAVGVTLIVFGCVAVISWLFVLCGGLESIAKLFPKKPVVSTAPGWDTSRV